LRRSETTINIFKNQKNCVTRDDWKDDDRDGKHVQDQVEGGLCQSCLVRVKDDLVCFEVRYNH